MELQFGGLSHARKHMKLKHGENIYIAKVWLTGSAKWLGHTHKIAAPVAIFTDLYKIW